MRALSTKQANLIRDSSISSETYLPTWPNLLHCQLVMAKKFYSMEPWQSALQVPQLRTFALSFMISLMQISPEWSQRSDSVAAIRFDKLLS